MIAFGSADSHDEQYFREPGDMVRGPVEDPTLTLDNAAIARRHVTAFLFQRYHEARLPRIDDPYEQPQLFEVLGTVEGFLLDDSRLNRHDFEAWLQQNESGLRSEVDSWLPGSLDPYDRLELLGQLVEETLRLVDEALPDNASATDSAAGEDERLGRPETVEGEPLNEAPPEVGDEPSTAAQSAVNLLDRLLYKGCPSPVRIPDGCGLVPCLRPGPLHTLPAGVPIRHRARDCRWRSPSTHRARKSG